MKNVKQVFGNGIYVLEAECAANTHLIENRKELESLLGLIRSRVRNYMNVLDFAIKPSGWHLLVKLKSENMIMKKYDQELSRRDKIPKRVLTTASGVVSEVVRLLRSRFTQITNPKRGRKGNASKCVYKKYYFETVEAARAYIKSVRKGELTLEQSNARYQANKAHYDEDGGISKGEKIMNSKVFQEEAELCPKILVGCLRLYDYLGRSFERWVEATRRLHKKVDYGGVVGR